MTRLILISFVVLLSSTASAESYVYYGTLHNNRARHSISLIANDDIIQLDFQNADVYWSAAQHDGEDVAVVGWVGFSRRGRRVLMVDHIRFNDALNYDIAPPRGYTAYVEEPGDEYLDYYDTGWESEYGPETDTYEYIDGDTFEIRD